MFERYNSENKLVHKLNRLWMLKNGDVSKPKEYVVKIKQGLQLLSFLDKKASTVDHHLLQELSYHFHDPKKEDLISKFTSLKKNQKNILASSLEKDLEKIKEKLSALQETLTKQQQALQERDMPALKREVDNEGRLIKDLLRLVKEEGEIAKKIKANLELVKDLEGNALFIRLMRRITKWYTNRNFVASVEGQENIPSHGPIMIAPRYHGRYDPAIYNSIFHRKVNFLSAVDVIKIGILKKAVRLFFKSSNNIAISRGFNNGSKGNGSESPMEVSRTIINFLRLNQAILIFPEGKPAINYFDKNDGDQMKIGKIKKGIFRLVLEAQKKLGKEIPIIPVGSLYGTIQPMKIYWKMVPKTIVSITIGEPFYLPMDTKKSEFDHYCQTLHQKLVKLSKIES